MNCSLPFPSPGDLPSPGTEPRFPTLQADSLPAKLQGKPKNTGVGSLSLLRRIFPTQESNWGLQHWRRILYQLSYQGKKAQILKGHSSEKQKHKFQRVGIEDPCPENYTITRMLFASSWHKNRFIPPIHIFISPQKLITSSNPSGLDMIIPIHLQRKIFSWRLDLLLSSINTVLCR